MLKVIAALGGLEARHRRADGGPQELSGATARLPQNRLQLGKRLLDRIQIGAVFRQIPETRARGLKRPPDRWTFVTRQVVHDDNVAGRQRRDQDLLDVGEEAHAIDRPIEDGWCRQARDAQRGEKRRRLPAAVRRLVGHTRPVEAAAVAPHAIGSYSTFIEKHETRGIERGGGRLPGGAGERDISAIVFGRAYRFF